LLEKTTKKDGTVRYCNNCDYKMTITEGGSDDLSKVGNEARLAG
jgi:hypothetical protein